MALWHYGCFMAKSTISNDPVRDQDKFIIRLPQGMRDRIKLQSEKNNRSMNAEIVATLEYAYPADKFDEAFFMVEFFRPILSMPVLSQKDKEERRSKVEKANDYLSRFEDVDFCVTLANVSGEELPILFRAPTKEQAVSIYDEAIATKPSKKAKKDANPK